MQLRDVTGGAADHIIEPPEDPVDAAGGDVLWAPKSCTWRIETIRKLTREPVRSDCFEGGLSTWYLEVHPSMSMYPGLHIYLVSKDVMWGLTAVVKLTVVNKADSSKSHSLGESTLDYSREASSSGPGAPRLITSLSTSEMHPAAGWLVNDTLVVKVDVTVKREDRFRLDAGGGPRDVTLKLPCGAEISVSSHLLQLASPFFRGALEDVQGGAPIPVDGGLGAWTYILSDICPQYEPPALTLSKHNELCGDPTYYYGCNVIPFLGLAEDLQQDDLRELCLNKLGAMTKEELKTAMCVDSCAGQTMQCVLRKEVEQLGAERVIKLLLLFTRF
ncbi:hypothetical protein FOA52_015065 [Chlamydomonas sp. UWO 241]|nr:hypothetical protein FOA52_015065 [Chlamydomonas sp. UWO 241]